MKLLKKLKEMEGKLISDFIKLKPTHIHKYYEFQIDD